MKKLVVFAAFLLGSAVAVKAQDTTQTVVEAKTAVAGAIITFDESKFDFGPIRQGEKVEHTFTFKNTGSQPLIVSNVFTTCGCTVSDWTKTPVLPGKNGFVKASFDSKGKMGKQHKMLTIESNNMAGNTNVSILTDIKPIGADLEAASEPVSQPAPAIETLAAPEKKNPVTTKTTKKAPVKKKKRSRR